MHPSALGAERSMNQKVGRAPQSFRPQCFAGTSARPRAIIWKRRRGSVAARAEARIGPFGFEYKTRSLGAHAMGRCSLGLTGAGL